MTLFTLSNLYAEDLSLHDVVINWSKICWDQNDEILLSGETRFLKTQRGRKWRGRIQIFTYKQGGTNPSRQYEYQDT